jgi:two-component system, LytTR family, response regulator
MTSAVIIDDEAANIGILRKLLSGFCPDVNVVAEATDVRTGINVINQHKPSLVFLDIEMPYGNAFDLLDQLMPVDFEVIFITAFNEYALKAFKYSALDYLLKPVNIDELKIAVVRAADRINTKNSNAQLNNLLQNLQKKNDFLRKIALPSKEGVLFVAVEDIIRCEASGAYTHFFVKGVGKIISAKNIKEYEEMLPEEIFFRIHHSHIININEITKYHRGRGGHVEMKDGAFIDVAVRRKDQFLSRFNR